MSPLGHAPGRAVVQLFVVVLLVLQPISPALALSITVPTGSVRHDEVPPLPPPPAFIVDNGSASDAGELSRDAHPDTVTLNDEVWITRAIGGELFSMDERVAVRVPRLAVMARSLLRYRASPYVPTLPPLLKATFDLALSDEAGNRIAAFERQVHLTVAYHFFDFPAGSSPTVLQFDLTTQRWAAVPVQVNTNNQTVTAEITTLGVYALTSGETQGKLSGMLAPALLGAAPSLWTGDAAFTYPLDTPTGYGGSRLALALSYSSSAANANLEVDYDKRRGQASDFGLGWSVQGAGAITRDDAGHYDLDFAGGSFQLRPISGTVDGWKTEPESFLQIIHQADTEVDINPMGPEFYKGNCPNTDYVGEKNAYLGKVYLKDRDTLPWTVRTPDGTTYTFGASVSPGQKLSDAQLGATATYWTTQWAPFNGATCYDPDIPGQGGDGQVQTAYRRPHHWYLTRIAPTAGEAWNFYYDADVQEIKKGGFANLCEAINVRAANPEAKVYVRHSRLDRIEPELGLHRIDLAYFAPEGHRSDQPDSFDWSVADGSGYDCSEQWQVSDHLAANISIRSRLSSAQPWDDATVQRVYTLHPSYDGYQHAQLVDIVQRANLTVSLTPARAYP